MSFAEEVKEANSGADTPEAEALNKLSHEIGRWAEDKGFREDWDKARDLDEFADAYALSYAGDPVAQKRAEMLHDTAEALRTNIIGTKLALAHSELSEALESLRNTGYKNLNSEGNFGEELADTNIRLLELSDMVGTAIGNDVMQKIVKNRTRPHMHGRKM